MSNYQNRSWKRRDTAKEIADLVPDLPYQLEEKVLVTVACKLGSEGEPLFTIDDLTGKARWDRVKDAVRLSINGRGSRLTRQAFLFSVKANAV